MRKKTISFIYPLLIMGVLVFFASSCKKDDDSKSGIPVLTTTAITSITPAAANSGGNITSDGGSTITARGVCWSTGQTPTISDNKTTNGTGTGSFASSISGLTANTTYYVRAYATNSNGTGYGNALSFTTQGSISNTFTDTRDGNVYHTVTIGSQVWMVENLRYLPNVVGSASVSGTTPYCYVYGYNGTNVATAKATANYSTYGVLYNWPAAVNACPAGWHLPSRVEWQQLMDYLGGFSVAGGKLKEAGTTHWLNPNVGATNESGFTALPGGQFNMSGGILFNNIGYGSDWWSSSELGSTAWEIRMEHYYRSAAEYTTDLGNGYYVRCLRD